MYLKLWMHKQVKLLVIIAYVLLAGCTSIPERNPLPPQHTSSAIIPGIPEARFWSNEWPKFSMERFAALSETDLRRSFPAIYGKPHNYLAISGGGANGAFGAGLLVGWSASGKRPEFTMVTGVSTGALTAPLVFLGADYDDELKKVYTETSTKDIAKEKNPIVAAFSDSVSDTKPLQKLIAKYITGDVVNAIAQEHKKGRRLFVGTMNLDAGRSVIWNIGAIAVSNFPDKLDLIHKVLRASASIPIIFPPVLISVEAEGNQYDEMHVDGGTGSQVFVYPAATDWKDITQKLKVQGHPNVYVVRNAFLEPDFQGIKRNVFSIASRSIDSLIRYQGIGDLYQIYMLCQRDGTNFNLAYIPPEFVEEPKEGFDPVYMGKLFELGYQKAVAGYPWQKVPPGMVLDH